ncbi:MAG TPA: 3-phosphoshikimate 1-carboxyvinyltransferase, partial [Dehalococcoidia bacterium]
MALPELIEVVGPARARPVLVTIPGSKSITNRALVLAALMSYLGKIELVGALQSEDTELMVAALRILGFHVVTDWESNPTVIVLEHCESSGDEYPPFPAELYAGNSGTTMRFLTALVTLGKGRFRLDGDP